MEFKSRNNSNSRDITHSFHQNQENGCDMTAVGPASMMKQACIALAAKNRANIAFKRGKISSRGEIVLSFRQNQVSGCDLITDGPASTMKQACIT